MFSKLPYCLTATSDDFVQFSVLATSAGDCRVRQHTHCPANSHLPSRKGSVLLLGTSRLIAVTHLEVPHVPKENSNTRKRLLDPIERSSEILFGLIMVLTFTGSFRASGADHDSVDRMLLGALGCNLAWGIIDGVFYLMATLSLRGHNLVLLREVQDARPEQGRALISAAISDDLADVLTDSEIESIRNRMVQLPRKRRHPRLHATDYRAALGVFLLVFLSTFPVVLPFVFMSHPSHSLRVSNAIALIMLFLTGCTYGKFAGGRTWRVGLVMVVIGVAMVTLTIALGG